MTSIHGLTVVLALLCIAIYAIELAQTIWKKRDSIRLFPTWKLLAQVAVLVAFSTVTISVHWHDVTVLIWCSVVLILYIIQVNGDFQKILDDIRRL